MKFQNLFDIFGEFLYKTWPFIAIWKFDLFETAMVSLAFFIFWNLATLESTSKRQKYSKTIANAAPSSNQF